MEKLCLKDICGYLPYGLKYEGFDNNIEVIYEINPSDKNISYINNGIYSISQIKPILRPISDLTKEINHKGNKFVPIVELAKVIYPNRDWEAFRDVALSENNEEFYYMDSGGFVLYDDEAGYLDSINQVGLFDKLNEWMFDYRQLIEKNLAIDVNNLENNPYE